MVGACGRVGLRLAARYHIYRSSWPGSSRPSTSWGAEKTWMPGTRPGMTNSKVSKASDKKPGALSQTPNQLGSPHEVCACRRRHRDHNHVGEGVKRHRDQAERHELERCVAGRRFDKLWNECEKECRGLGIERLDEDAFPKCPPCSGPHVLFGRHTARLAEGLDAEPDQIEGASELEHGKELRAGKNNRRDAKAAGDDANKPTQRRSKGGCDTCFLASRQRPRRHIENAGTGDCGNDQSGQQEQRKVRAAHL